MKIFRFDVGTATPIDHYNSERAAVKNLIPNANGASLNCIYLGVGGTLGRHQAVSNQLFVVVSGRGWVQSGDDDPIAIQTGQAAFWQAGELHTSGTHHGMVAIVIEADELVLSPNLKEYPHG